MNMEQVHKESVTLVKLVIEVFQALSEYLYLWHSGFIEEM